MGLPGGRDSLRGLAVRVFVIVAVALLVVGLALLAWKTAEALLLVFAGGLLAIFLRMLSQAVSRWLRVPARWSFAATVLGLLLLFGGLGWALAPRVSDQATQLIQVLPGAVSSLAARFDSYSWGPRLLSQLRGALLQAGLFTSVFGTLRLTVDALARLVFVVFIGLFVGADPGRYRRGLVRLLPPPVRPRAHKVLGEIILTLRQWLLGQLVAMLLIGSLVGLGLWLLGVPLALTLGLLAGLLEFIPFIGPIVAALPALALAFVQGPWQALYVLLLFLGIQQVEGNAVQPLIQQRMVALPPLITLTATLLAAALFGFVGILVATPLTAVALVLVKMLLQEDVYGDGVELPGNPP